MHWRCANRPYASGWFRPTLAIALALPPGACASRRAARQVSGAEDRIRKIQIVGNEALDDEAIEEHLNLEQTQWFPLPRRAYLYEGYLEIDRQRIEELYDAHGHYDAVVTNVAVKRVREHVVDVVFEVEEGLPTEVRAVEVRWPEGPPTGPQDDRVAPGRVAALGRLTEGETFDVEELHDSEAAMESALRSRGYAFAKVEGTARVDRTERVAEVGYTLVPGPFVRLGRLEIEGLRTVPERAVRTEVEDVLGKPYSPARLERIEDAIYGLSVFSTVAVTHADEPRDGPAGAKVVDVKVVVEEGRPQQVELGVSLGLQPTRWEQLASVRYTHENLAQTLTSLSVRLEAGYAELPALYRPDEHGPVGTLAPRLRKKGLLEKKLVWTLEPMLQLGIWPGYQFWAASNRVGVSRFFTRFVLLGLSHNLRFVDFFDVSPVLDRSRSILGLDFRDPYLLSYIQLHGALYLTDRVAAPRHGVQLETRYDLAGGIFGGQFDFHRITPELRGYYTPLDDRLQLAARARLGFIVPFGDEPGAPIDEKLYLGGADTVRGWGPRQLSPALRRCPTGEDCLPIPIGGYTSVLMNVEARVRVWRELWGVAFFDVGDVQEEVGTFDPSHWAYTVGPGLRYQSPIGQFRLDVGIKLNDPWNRPDEPMWALHFGLGDAF